MKLSSRAGAMRMQPLHQSARVLALTLLLALSGGAATLTITQPDSVTGRGLLPWWALAPMFALAEVLAVPARLRGARVHLPLTAAPLVLGLFLATPVDLLVGRVLAATVVAVAWRDRRALRLGLDAALVAAGVAAALAVFASALAVVPTALARADPPDYLAGATAALAAAAVTGLLDTSVVVLVAGWYEGRTPGWEAARLLLVSLAGSLVAGAAGLLVVVHHLAPGAGAGLALACAAGFVAHRGLASLAHRRRSLQGLHELSAAFVAAPASSDVVELLLGQSMVLLRARYAEVVLAAEDVGRAPAVPGSPGSPGRPDGPGAPGQGSCWVRRAGEPLQGPGPVIRPDVDSLPGPAASHLTVAPTTPAGRAFLAARRLGDALVVRLLDEGQVTGHLLVGDRQAPSIAPMLDSDGRLLETVANHASVLLRNHRLIRRLHVEARQDELTGLPNRLQLRELLEGTAHAMTDHGPPCAVMVLDFNGFKAINDTLGHQAGDELLRLLAGRLAAAAGADATVARLGGDEFAVLSTSCADAAGARSLAGRLLAVFAEPVLVAGARLRLSGSLGIALGPEHGSTGSDLLRNADIAMYAAKAAGGGQRLFSADLVELTASGLTLATDLRDAIDRQEISVVVQPLVDLVTDELHSVEVLARWQHPDLGEVPPEQFFTAAERSGQVQALSKCVLDRALGLSQRWQAEGLRVRVAVNLAARWLAEPTLPEQVGAALARHGVAADMLCLELTERSVIADPRRANETLARLRAMGVHLSVDDFGTGYSSLTYLSRLPVDQMKIDKSFVADLDVNERDRAIVRSMIDLGRNLGLEVVAEGVMTPGARAALAELGCRLGQGFLIARPLDPDELPGHLAERAERRAAAGPPVPTPRGGPERADDAHALG